MAIPLAWISGPGISRSSVVGVACRSWSTDAVDPTTMTLPSTADRGKSPRATSRKLSARIENGGPTKSSQPLLSGGSGIARPKASRAAAVSKPSRPRSSYMTLRIRPSLDALYAEKLGVAPSFLTTALPPRIWVLPSSSTSVVARTTRGAAARIACRSALSESGLPLGSVNWTS